MGKTRSRHSRHSRYSRHSRHYRKKHDTKRRVGRTRHKSRQSRRKYRKRSRRNKKGGMQRFLNPIVSKFNPNFNQHVKKHEARIAQLNEELKEIRNVNFIGSVAPQLEHYKQKDIQRIEEELKKMGVSSYIPGRTKVLPAKKEKEKKKDEEKDMIHHLFETYPGYATALINKYNKDINFKQDVVNQINISHTFAMTLTIDTILMDQYRYYIEMLVRKGKNATDCLPKGWIWKKDDSTSLVKIVKDTDD